MSLTKVEIYKKKRLAKIQKLAGKRKKQYDKYLASKEEVEVKK